jgi:hypothetical protein
MYTTELKVQATMSASAISMEKCTESAIAMLLRSIRNISRLSTRKTKVKIAQEALKRLTWFCIKDGLHRIRWNSK